MHWSFTYSIPVIAFGALALVLSVYFSWRQLRISQMKTPVVLLESLRTLVIILIVFTLLRPEIVTRIQHKKEPQIAILQDLSGSMGTNDLVLTDNSVVTRSTAVKSLLDNRFYAPLEGKFKIHLQGFSPTADPKESGTVETVEGTNLEEALTTKLAGYENLRAVILMSDGDWNIGASPLAPSIKLRSLKIPVFSIVFGGENHLPDIELKQIRAPAFCLLNEKISIPVSIENRMNEDISTKIIMSSPTGTEFTKDIKLPANSTLNDSIIWQPKRDGKYPLTIQIPEEKGELIKENNSGTFEISVRKESLKVLVVESLQRWEYRYLRNALSRDPGIEVKTILYHPDIGIGGGKNYLSKFPPKNELSSFDVIFLGDVGISQDQLSKEDAENIEGLVRHQGSGLVFMPGIKGNHISLLDSPLSDLLPVELDRSNKNGLGSSVESKMLLTTAGREHFLTMLADTPLQNGYLWRELPGFYWNAASISAKPGSNILAVHSGLKCATGRMPLLVTRESGNGNVLFMGTDSAWRWRKGVEDKYHYRFWGQVIRWMSHKRHISSDEGIRLFYSPENPRAGQTVFINATVTERGGMPLNDAEPVVNIKSKNGSSLQRFKLFPDKSGWGIYKGEFKPEKSGTYVLNTECREKSISLNTEITVSRESREKTGEPAKWNTMKEISQITAGEFAEARDATQIIDKIMAIPKYDDTEKRFFLWCQWWWGMFIIILMTIYLAGRKIAGLV